MRSILGAFCFPAGCGGKGRQDAKSMHLIGRKLFENVFFSCLECFFEKNRVEKTLLAVLFVMTTVINKMTNAKIAGNSVKFVVNNNKSEYDMYFYHQLVLKKVEHARNNCQ
jgi:hypothetical protein